MDILNQYLAVVMMKIYFYLMGEETLTRTLGDRIELKTEIDKAIYVCTCQEVIFKATAKRWLSSTRLNRIYRVTMRHDLVDAELTYGTYPVLCPDTFTYTSYPHMMAIRCHHKLYYT